MAPSVQEVLKAAPAVTGLPSCLNLLDRTLAWVLQQLHGAKPHAEASLHCLQWDGRLAAALDGFAGQLPAAAASQARFVRSALGLPRHANAVVTNGRVVELPGDASSAGADASSAGAELEPADFELLELYAQRNQFCREVAQLVGRASQVRGAGGLASRTCRRLASHGQFTRPIYGNELVAS